MRAMWHVGLESDIACVVIVIVIVLVFWSLPAGRGISLWAGHDATDASLTDGKTERGKR